MPYPVYFWTVAFLAIAGLADSIYLSISHYRVYIDIGYSSFCAISKAINCDTVSQSPYSLFLGLPVSVWGIIGYTFFVLFLPLAKSATADKKRLWSILFLVSLVFSIYSIILAFISTFIIRSYCIMCILSFGINFMLFFYTWMIRKRFDSTTVFNGLRADIKFLQTKKRLAATLFTPFFSGLILITIFYPSYWQLEVPERAINIAVGITEDGHPWIGAQNPILVITEYTDYRCFQCKKMHYFLRQLIAKHRDKIRLVHRHFPMDHQFNPLVKEPFHVGSGKMALMAIYASTRDKFWPMNDLLFELAGEKKALNIKDIAKKLGMNYKELVHSTNDKIIRNTLLADIRSGLRLNITGTPAYVINDKVYLAQIPSEIFKKALD